MCGVVIMNRMKSWRVAVNNMSCSRHTEGRLLYVHTLHGGAAIHLRKPAGGFYSSGDCAVFAQCKTRPAAGRDDWFLALVNNSSGLNANDAPPIMHCLPSKDDEMDEKYG